MVEKIWSHPPDSNRRPTDYESVALPTELGWLIFYFPTVTPCDARGTCLGVVKSVVKFSAIFSTASALWLGLNCD